MPEVFVAAQGLGRAVNFAHSIAAENNVYFIELYDTDLYPQSIISRSDFDRLKPGDVIVTAFPKLYFAKYPDIFAIMHDAQPVASFPTEWCTSENWVEERTYWFFRRFQDEPNNCNAQVFRVSDIAAAQKGQPLEIHSLRADSSLSSDNGPEKVFARPDPVVPISLIQTMTGVIGSVGWSSDPSSGPHWLEMTFAKAALLKAITVVPTDYFAAPQFRSIGRPDAVRIYGSAVGERDLRLLWSGQGLRDSAIIAARFPATRVATLRITLTQPPAEPLNYSIAVSQRLPASPVAGIEYVHFPGYFVVVPASVHVLPNN
jgi:hypothetical protein